MVLADATVLHGAVPEVQRQLVADAPLLLRLAFAWRGALFDEVVLRLGVVTALVWLGQAGLGLRDGVRVGRPFSPRHSLPGR